MKRFKTAFCLSVVFSIYLAPAAMAHEPHEAPSQQYQGIYRLGTGWAIEVSPTTHLDLGIVSLGFTDGACTATLISKEGHLLLARHCLEGAIFTSDENSKYKGTGKLDLLSRTEFANQFSADTFNTVNIVNHLEVPVGIDRSVVYAKITALGKGYLSPVFAHGIKDPEVRRKHQSLNDEGYSIGGDFAIVQIPNLAGKACYRFSNKIPQRGDALHSLSFSCSRDESKPWPSVRQSTVLMRAKNGMDTAEAYLPKGSIVTDTKAEKCNSGTAMLNVENQITGVLHTVVHNAKTQETHSISIGIDRIFELIPVKTKTHLLELNSLCERK